MPNTNTTPVQRSKFSLFLGLTFLLVSQHAFAQEAKRATARYLDELIGVGSGQLNLSFSYQYNWKFGEKQKLEMGVGARLNFFTAKNKYFVTAPAKIVKGESGPGVLFKDKIPANMDSVFFPAATIGGLNVLLNIRYHLSEKFSAGFNMDVIGFSFGRSNSGTYINGTTSQQVTASPTRFNLLLIGENDLGSLNSEFFVAYKYNRKGSVKLGVQHIFMEYTTDTKVQQFPEPNDRFRITPTVVCFGLILTLR